MAGIVSEAYFCVREVGGSAWVVARPARGEEAKVTDEFGTGSTEGSSAGRDKKYADPYGLYRRWFETWGDIRKGGSEAGMGVDEIEELWRRWFAGTAKGLGGSGGDAFAGSLGPLWKQMAESIREESASGENLPEDPVEFFLKWYAATSEKWSGVADDLLRKEDVLKSNALAQENFARSYRELRNTSEESLRNLQIPSRSDVARVAKLVVGVENKVDRLEEAFGGFVYGGSEPATAEAVNSLRERMEALEGKMDRILSALEKERG